MLLKRVVILVTVIVAILAAVVFFNCYAYNIDDGDNERIAIELESNRYNN